MAARGVGPPPQSSGASPRRLRHHGGVSHTSATAALLPIEEAFALIAARVVALPAEDVALEQAFGRFLSGPLAAPLGLPPFTNSAMDGFALRSADTPGTLAVIGESAAGSPFRGRVGPGQAVMISTGGMVPEGADAVAQVEIVTRSVDGARITLEQSVALDEAVRHAGTDVARGQQVLAPGTRIGPAQIGAAAALGLQALRCGSVPRVAVLSTGSELRPLGRPLEPGQIYDSNSPMLEALARSAGVRVTRISAVADSMQAHREALALALEHDVVISSGGVSVGPHDLVRSVGATLGIEDVFWRVALRPGKPVSFGVRDRTLVFGLPGNPVSTLVGFELFVRPALYGLQGAQRIRPAFVTGVLAVAVKRHPRRDELIRVKLTADGSLEPLAHQQSYQIAAAAGADGLARIPLGEGTLPAGAQVELLLL